MKMLSKTHSNSTNDASANHADLSSNPTPPAATATQTDPTPQTTPNTPAFDRVYKMLNAEQKKAVDAIEGPVMVMAGPGTGKTQVLAARIANILKKTDVSPFNILALTFTEAAAKNMRERVVKMIGKEGYYVQISTFHSFCSEVVRTNPEYFPIDRGSEPLSDLEKYDLFQNIMKDLSLKVLYSLNKPQMYTRDIISAIANLKKESISPGDFEEILQKEGQNLQAIIEENENSKKKIITKTALQKKQKSLAKQKELVAIYHEYEKRLRHSLRYDFEDMIALVAQAFSENESLLLDYQEKLQYFLVDEYQDTNNAQNEVVDLLASYWGDEANIFVVGDPHQSIFRFQGASVENMLGFINRYKSALIITLTTGYRCHDLLYSAAHQLIANNELTSSAVLGKHTHQKELEVALDQQLTSPHGEGDKINFYTAPSQTVELIYVAEQVKNLINIGVEPEEVAILYHKNIESTELQEIFEKWGIRYEIDGGDDVLSTEVIRQLLELFKLILAVRVEANESSLFEVMCYEWSGLNKLSVMKLMRSVGQSKEGVVGTVLLGFDRFSSKYPNSGLSEEQFTAIEQFVTHLLEWSVLDAQQIFTKWFEQVINQSGFLNWILEHEHKIEYLTNLNSLYREVKALASSNHELKLQGFLDSIELMKEYKISLRSEDLNISRGAVRFSTVHKAKGQEWDHVFIIHLTDKKWGNVRDRNLVPLPEGLIKNVDISKKERNEDERRLFYVALTRARKRVTLSFPETTIMTNRTKDEVKSMFIDEIDDFLKPVSEENSVEFLENYQQNLSKLLMPPPVMEKKIEVEQFLKNIVDNMSLSLTKLNLYLRDPQEFVNSKLLHVPRAKEPYESFGTAVHKALEEYYKYYKKHDDKLPLADLQQIFRTSLENELMDKREFTKRLDYGFEVLEKYHQIINLDGVDTIFIERFFGGGANRAMLGDIRLDGRMDRVDWIDREKKTVRVIDYKTGPQKTINAIEGKVSTERFSERELNLPENLRGPYQRQLLFYRLLADLDPTFLPKVTEGVFVFVEPDKSSGKIVTRVFELTDQDVNDLRGLIVEVMSEIRSLKFMNEVEMGSVTPKDTSRY